MGSSFLGILWFVFCFVFLFVEGGVRGVFIWSWFVLTSVMVCR